MNGAGTPDAGPDPRAVERMFSAVADRYDLLNHLLSLSVDRWWRRCATLRLGSLGAGPGDRCLDLCTGTGDLAVAAGRRLGLQVVASDFCHPMLLKSVPKIRGRGLEHPIRLAEADAMRLPFRSSSFRFVTVAFGVRNLARLDQGLAEILRVLIPGGAVVILEFSSVDAPLVRGMYRFYFTRILPRIGAWISGVEGPYRYLPDSVGRFPSQEPFARLIASAGFEQVQYENLSGGIAALHWGRKPG